MDGKLQRVREEFQRVLGEIDDVIRSLEDERRRMMHVFEEKLGEALRGQYNPEFFEEFFEEPYVVLPKRRNEYYVVAPKWLRMELGYLERQTKGYNVFVINRYLAWIYDLPRVLKEKLHFEEGLPVRVVDGVMYADGVQEEAWSRYRHFLSQKLGNGMIRVKRGMGFRLIAQLIEDGTLPFEPTPVAASDLRDWKPPEELRELYGREYVKRAWKRFLETGAVGVFWAFGTGKSMFALYACARLKGEKLVVVPTLTLKEQWEERIRRFAPFLEREVSVETYHAFHKVKNREYTLVVFEEAQHLPANTFIRLATLRTKYRIGLSGSPFREDGRENYIIALTGFPIGLSWREQLEHGYIKEPTVKLYLARNEREKLRKLEELVSYPMKTIIFCDWIELGKKISRRLGVPFVHGATKERKKILEENPVVVVSRVGDEGVSVRDLERVIEVAFLYGSRMQEAQRFGRLLHSSRETEHIIIMTHEEYDRYGKRLHSIVEKGFKIQLL